MEQSQGFHKQSFSHNYATNIRTGHCNKRSQICNYRSEMAVKNTGMDKITIHDTRKQMLSMASMPSSCRVVDVTENKHSQERVGYCERNKVLQQHKKS